MGCKIETFHLEFLGKGEVALEDIMEEGSPRGLLVCRWVKGTGKNILSWWHVLGHNSRAAVSSHSGWITGWRSAAGGGLLRVKAARVGRDCFMESPGAQVLLLWTSDVPLSQWHFSAPGRRGLKLSWSWHCSAHTLVLSFIELWWMKLYNVCF